MDWADAVHRIYRPTYADDPPVGWCGGAWIDAFSAEEDCWETVALDNADALRRKLRGFDVRYLWTSQTNLIDGIPGDWLRADEGQIPSGLAGFFAKLRERGFVPALWVAPFWFFAEAAGALEENRENLLKDKSGAPICERRSWEFDLHSDPDDKPRLHQYFLDGSHPGTAEHVRRIFAAYRKLGVRYYMLDFLAVKKDARLHDPTRTPLQAARSILEVIRDAAGPDTHLQTAVSSTPGYVGLIDAARVGRDFGEGRPLFPPYNNWRNAVYALHDRHFGSIEYLVQNAAASFFTHRRTYLNDFNLLTVDKPVPIEHARVAATVFGLGGSPLMLGDDYRRIDPERLRLVKLCLPRTRGMPVPVDLFDDVHPGGYSRMLKLEIDTGWETYVLVAVFNMDDEAYATDLSFLTSRTGVGVGVSRLRALDRGIPGDLQGSLSRGSAACRLSAVPDIAGASVSMAARHRSARPAGRGGDRVAVVGRAEHDALRHRHTAGRRERKPSIPDAAQHELDQSRGVVSDEGGTGHERRHPQTGPLRQRARGLRASLQAARHAVCVAQGVAAVYHGAGVAGVRGATPLTRRPARI